MNFTEQQELYAQVIQRAWDDPEFKQRLISNPVPTIEAEIGQKLNIPQGVTLVVEDQTDSDTAYINIPPSMDNVELKEEELEAISGGQYMDPSPGELRNPLDIFKKKVTF